VTRERGTDLLREYRDVLLRLRGVDEHLVKPVMRDTLNAAIAGD